MGRWGRAARLHDVVTALVVLLVVAVRVTLTVNDPVNQAVRGWRADDEPAGWRDQRARWERGHRVRRVLLGLAALAAAAAR